MARLQVRLGALPVAVRKLVRPTLSRSCESNFATLLAETEIVPRRRDDKNPGLLFSLQGIHFFARVNYSAGLIRFAKAARELKRECGECGLALRKIYVIFAWKN